MLSLLAGPYRVVMYRFRTFGGIGTGLITWAGVILAYPIFVASWTPFGLLENRAFLASWIALVLWSYVQMFAKWCSVAPRREPGVSHCWFGRWEPVFALGLSFAMSAACGPGSGRFFLTGYACSVAQIGIVRLRKRLGAWTPEDTQRLVSPVRDSAQRLAPVAIRGAGWTKSALRKGALSLIPFGMVLLHSVKSLYGRPAPATSGEAVPATRSPTFMNRVFCHMVASLVLSLVTGAISFRAIFRCFSFVLAIPLWLAGWDMSPPADIKDEARSVASQVNEVLHEEQAKVQSRLEKERDEIERRKRQAAWEFFTR